MFTNWLANPSSASMGTLPPSVITTPPDIILEVGPSPSVRFFAHSIVLTMQSGYLRSAIHLDENGVPNTDLPIYLSNVTPEQFSPLLTYMYTGYLDLNIENIFSVLLATHVLHMPRALEICRAFLSRMQSEGYLNGSFLNHLNETTNNSMILNPEEKNSVKVIRPIASKPTIPTIQFIAPPMPNISLSSTGTPFRSLNDNNNHENTIHNNVISSNKSPIEANENDFHSLEKSSPLPSDSSSKLSTLIKDTSLKTIPSTKLKRSPSNKLLNLKTTSTIYHNKSPQQQQKQQEPLSKDSRKEILESENKTIIDVASCDGPVRFRRILNDAYGKQPETIDLIHVHTQQLGSRSQQSVSHSFHQQMLKNINQLKQQQQQQKQQHKHYSNTQSEKSEDSSFKHQQHQNTTTTTCNIEQTEDDEGEDANNQQSTTGEIYNCVYCRHTFKSQYCYQKHAKRHLNPLSLEGTRTNGGRDSVTGIVNHPNTSTHQQQQQQHHQQHSISRQNDKIEKKSYTIIDSKREVRPLDMNVQYYPCKTCGSKFPSYYFVHKHRKLCHANDENN